jgi:hypothetical protein
MFGSEMLEVAVGIVFVFLIVSVMCSAIREAIEARLKTRAAYLERGIRELLHDTHASGNETAPGLARAFYAHPLIYGLYASTYTPGEATARPALLARGGGLPSYIPSRNFALALMDIAARGPITDEVSSDPASPVLSLDSIRRNILNVGSAPVQRVLLTAVDSAQGDINKAQAMIEAWFDSGMDRVSGWYKRTTHWIIFWIGLAVAIVLNINTITIADYLYRNDTARAALAARAQTVATDTAFLQRSYREISTELDSLSLPIGWSAGWGAPRRTSEAGADGVWNDWIAPVLGWLLTALAATMGASFWFDLLNKVMVVRSTVKPHEKSPEEGSEDRQLGSRRTTDSEEQGTMTRGGIRGPARVTPPSRSEGIPAPRDATSAIDGCDVDMADATTVTADEDLPPAEGGVA